MSKKKTRKRVMKTIVPKVSTVFDCPFCNHKGSVETKMYHINKLCIRDKKKMVGFISCKVCSANYKIKTNNLTEPIDIYYEWIDEAERINAEKELGNDILN